MNTIRINLLPWRDEQKIIQENMFRRMLIYAVIVGVVIGMGIWGLMQFELEKQQSRVATIQNVKDSQYRNAEKLLSENEAVINELNERLGVLTELTEQRKNVVSVMESLAAAEVEGVFIYSLQFDVNRLVFGAIADSQDSLIKYLNVLESKVGVTPIPDYSEYTIKGQRLISANLTINPANLTSLK